MSHVLSLVGDEATRAEGVTLLPVGAKWSALALECVGVCSSGLRLTPDEELSMDEVTTCLHCLCLFLSSDPTPPLADLTWPALAILALHHSII